MSWSIESLKEYVDRRFVDRDIAVVVAASNVDRRLTEMNELRRQIESERGLFLTVDSYEQQHSALEDHVQALDDKVGVRILAVERWQSKIIGALALTTFVLPMVVGFIVYLLTRHAVPVSHR